MYRLVLVDDESDIREGLQEVIDFHQYGFDVVGEASNGVEAVQVCEQVRPDLVITDIRMPLLDGLSMIRQVRKVLPATRYIILSGYDDFEYARQALAINCLGYMLKPISSAEFTEMLAETKLKLDEEFDRRRDLTRLRQHFVSSLPLLKETLLSALASGGMDVTEAQARAVRYDMPLHAAQYTVALIRPQYAAAQADRIDDPELLTFAVMNIAQEILTAHCRTQLFHYQGLVGVLLLQEEAGSAAFDAAAEWLEEARHSIDHYLKTGVLVGVGVPFARLEQMPGSMRQAMAALDQCTIWEDQPLLCMSDFEPRAGQALAADEAELRRLCNALKLGSAEEAMAALVRLMDACRCAKPTPQMYRAYLLEIFTSILRTARDSGAEPNGEENRLLEKLMACPAMEEAQASLENKCRALCQNIRENRATSSRKIAHEAENYIKNNYTDEELTVEKLCRHLHVSPSYFSVLFKRETRKTFLQYLTEIRMDKAMNLLAGSDMRTAQIALAVGIPEPSYFSYCFKKHFGIPPAQAKRQKGGA